MTLDELRDGRPHEPAKVALRPITEAMRIRALAEIATPVQRMEPTSRNGMPYRGTGRQPEVSHG